MNAKRKPQIAKAPIPTEYELHLTVAKFLNHALPPGCHWFHSPLGGLRHATEAKRLKAMGATAGLPDIGLVHQGRICWLELKRARGAYLSPAQAWCHRQLAAAGSPVSVCKSLADVEEALRKAGIPIKARTI